MIPAHALLKLSMSPSSCKSIRWVFNCSQWSISSSDWFKCLKSIQPEDRERIGRFVFRNDAMSSMAAQLLMRKCLVETGVISWKNLRLARSEKGKPYVPGLRHVQFSVSHHGQLTVLAAEVFETENSKEGETWDLSEANCTKSSLSPLLAHTVKPKTQTTDKLISPLETKEIETIIKNKPPSDNNTNFKLETNTYKVDILSPSLSNVEKTVQITEKTKISPCLGVDICNQDLPRNSGVSEFFRLMRRNFHEEEWLYILAGQSESLQLARFYRIWALKESFVKATGTGIAVPLEEICFHVASELELEKFVYNTKLVLRGRIAGEWNFEETQLINSYCVAVAVCNGTFGDVSVDKRYEEVTFSDVEALMEDFEVEEEEELYYASRDFEKKPLRSWDK